MAIVTIYSCDKCGHAQETTEQMWEVGVGLKPLPGPHGYSTPRPLNPKVEWCRSCVEGIGLLIPSPKPKEPAKPATLEDIVRELVREEMDQS